MKKQFSIKKALIFAVEALINHFFLFFGIGLFTIFILIILLLYGLFLAPQFFAPLVKLIVAVAFGGAPGGYGPANQHFWQAWAMLSKGPHTPYLILTLTGLLIVWSIINIFFQLGITKIILNIYDRKPVHFSLLFSQYHLIIKGCVATLLYCLMVMLGLAFFILPGIIFLIRFGFYLPYLVDTNCSILESFSRSWRLSSHVTIKLFAICGILMLISIFLIKSFWLSILLDTLVFIYLYRVLKKQQNGSNGRNGKIAA